MVPGGCYTGVARNSVCLPTLSVDTVTDKAGRVRIQM
jgi:hypothetical protein